MSISQAILSFACNGVFLAFPLLFCGCDRMYVVEGKVVVVRGAGAAVVPAVLCVGKGGPLDSSGIYGHPANTVESSAATLFCGPAPDDVEFPQHETITQGWMPRFAHVYAWLEPVPAAKKLCARSRGGP